jgi:hypothetical protein
MEKMAASGQMSSCNEENRIIAIYDLKTGNAIIRPPRASELRTMTGAGADVPVIELHSTRGPARR